MRFSIFACAAAGVLSLAVTVSAQDFSPFEDFDVMGVLPSNRVLVEQDRTQFACRLEYARGHALVSDCMSFTTHSALNRSQPRVRAEKRYTAQDAAREIEGMDQFEVAQIVLRNLQVMSCDVGARTVATRNLEDRFGQQIINQLGLNRPVARAVEPTVRRKHAEALALLVQRGRAQWYRERELISPRRCN